MNQDVTSSLDEAVKILEDTHATENQDHNDSDNESSVSESGYDGDISESDSDISDASESNSDMSDVRESDSDTSDSSDISDSDSNMSYTSESDSNMSNVSDSINNSDTAQRSYPWDLEYLQLIQSAIDNLAIETIYLIRLLH